MPGQIPGPNGTRSRPATAPGNVYALYCRAVSAQLQPFLKIFYPLWLLNLQTFIEDIKTGLQKEINLNSFLRTSLYQIKTASISIAKQMQMERNNTMTIQDQGPSAFVFANGNTSRTTRTAQVHLPRRIYGDNSEDKHNRGSMLQQALTRSIKLIHLSQFLQASWLLHRDKKPTHTSKN